MRSRSFSLKPFPSTPGRLDLKITGSIYRRGQTLAIRYELSGRLAELAVAGPAEAPARRHGLWEGTCFELFLAPQESPRYWEFNLSPAGHWNVYRFEKYRKGMAEETAFTALPFRVQRREDALSLALELDLKAIVPAGRALEAAIAAVLKSREGETSYWALTHPGQEADFHRRDGFILEL